MGEQKSLDTIDLKCICDPSIFAFNTTDEIEPFDDGIIGQKRATRAIDLGMKVKQEGYNIYMAGDTGTGRTTYAKQIAREKAEEKEVPRDLCYVYNFQDSEKPRSLILPPGYGIGLSQDMDKIVTELKEEIPQAFAGEEYEEQKREVMNQYQVRSNKLMEDFEKEIREEDFILQNTSQGPMPVPIDEDGEPIEQEEFQKMDEDKRKELREKSQEIQNQMEKVMEK